MTFQSLKPLFYYMYNKKYYGNLLNNAYYNWKNVYW